MNWYLQPKKHPKGKELEEAFVHQCDAVCMLVHCLHTSIRIKLLSEEVTRLDFALADTCFQQSDRVSDQRLLLQHGGTGENLLSAASLLLLDPLPPEVRPHRQPTQPLGTLLHDVVTRQTVLGCERQPAGQQEAASFALPLQAPCLARTILSFVPVPVLLVHEMLPLSRGT
ncbi:hypothetical protein ccbrp13_60060 [Ktedonobacteria bacterium brp13]|nr:hypothetical protein ccbrp13_60060 [Ktedonobacteria bacterium brp13]